MVGGALQDCGHALRLLDAECRHLTVEAIAKKVRRRKPDAVMTGHAGSMPAHPVTVAMLRAIKAACPHITTVYGGDWLNAMYVTPHDWTPFGRTVLTGRVVEPDQSKWDYRHQVLAQRLLTTTSIFFE